MANPVMDVEVALAERVASSIGMAVPKAGRSAIIKDAWAADLHNDWHNAALNWWVKRVRLLFLDRSCEATDHESNASKEAMATKGTGFERCNTSSIVPPALLFFFIIPFFKEIPATNPRAENPWAK
jgi:hypothetical protein